MVYLDTSALIRYFTLDDKNKAELVALLLEKEKEVRIIDAVFPEVEYVLSKVYFVSKDEIIDAFNLILGFSNIRVSNYIPDAIELYKQTNLSTVDCIIVTTAKNNKIASFDKKLLQTTGVKSYWLDN